MEIQEYLTEGAQKLFSIQLKEAYDQLTNSPDYVKERLKKMKEINNDMLLFEKLGLIENRKSIRLGMVHEITGLENKLIEAGSTK